MDKDNLGDCFDDFEDTPDLIEWYIDYQNKLEAKLLGIIPNQASLTNNKLKN